MVSELIVEIQNIKYKSDELTLYYQNDHYIDLSNVNSILVNTLKEMTHNSEQYRVQNNTGKFQGQAEPMEIDNIQINKVHKFT